MLIAACFTISPEASRPANASTTRSGDGSRIELPTHSEAQYQRTHRASSERTTINAWGRAKRVPDAGAGRMAMTFPGRIAAATATIPPRAFFGMIALRCLRCYRYHRHAVNGEGNHAGGSRAPARNETSQACRCRRPRRCGEDHRLTRAAPGWARGGGNPRTGGAGDARARLHPEHCRQQSGVQPHAYHRGDHAGLRQPADP